VHSGQHVVTYDIFKSIHLSPNQPTAVFLLVDTCSINMLTHLLKTSNLFRALSGVYVKDHPVLDCQRRKEADFAMLAVALKGRQMGK